MLAYVYLMMGENGEAARLTQEVIDSKEFTLMNRTEVINSGFSSVSIPGWMWAIDLTTSNSPALLHSGDIWTCLHIAMRMPAVRN